MTKPFIVAILSGKGGVGKTTISLNLARHLSHCGPVWLIDIDLFNRGATSALWVSEKGIPVSVAELIIDLEDNPEASGDRDALTNRFEARLREVHERLAYDRSFALLPAARAREGRQASHFLWRGMREVGVYAETFVAALANACARVTPDCIVVLDGHGGLDELSVAAALVSDLCYIINEPDLITFTGSVTLFREISDQSQASENEAWVEFIINRVSPRHRVEAIEADFGAMLDAMSPAREAVAVYFPLEPELFGVFGDDPFVSELYTRYWFSRKIDYLADRVIEFGMDMQKLRRETWQRKAGDPKPTLATRTALRREFHKRGDALLTSWLSTIAGALLLVVWKLLQLSRTFSSAPPTVLVISVVLFAIFLGITTIRWIGVQQDHLANVRRLRGKSGRRLRFGDSEAAARQEVFEHIQQSKAVNRPLRLVIIIAAILGVFAIVTVPSILTALQRSKQRRTGADMLSIATALEARATDTNDYYADNGSHLASQLKPVLQPTYIRETPTVDAWGTGFRYYSFNRESDGRYVSYAFVSAGRDREFQYDDLMKYPLFENRTPGSIDSIKKPRNTTDFNADLVFIDGRFLQKPEQLQFQ